MIRSGALGRRVAPTPEQRLLLRAALLEGPAGREAWDAWRRQADIERLDPGSQLLLPQLYLNRRAEAANDPEFERLKGVYRHAWSANAALLRDASRVLGALAAREIRTVVVDGTAIVTRYYRDHGARAIDSIAVLVSPDDVPDALRVLLTLGWAPATSVHPLTANPYVSQFRLTGRGRPVDLLWDPFPEGCSPETRLQSWSHAEPAEVAGVATAVLAPTDELLRICVRAARWEDPPPFRRLADAAVLLREAGAGVEWSRLIAQASRARVVLPVSASLTLLREILDAPVPEEPLVRLTSASVDPGDWLEQRLRQAPRPRLGRLPDLLFRYRRLAAPEFAGTRRPGLARYLQGAWGVRRPWQLPLVALGKGVRRIVRAR